MPLRDILKKRDGNNASSPTSPLSPTQQPPPSPLPDVANQRNQSPISPGAAEESIPKFTILRTTTTSEEIIQPPSFYSDDGAFGGRENSSSNNVLSTENVENNGRRGSRFRWPSYSGSRRSSRQSSLSAEVHNDEVAEKEKEGGYLQEDGGRSRDRRRLSERLRLRSRSRSRSTSANSANLPADLGELDLDQARSGEGDGEDREAEWERRATLGLSRSRAGSTAGSVGSAEVVSVTGDERVSKERKGSVSREGTESSDSEIQEAIRLHEEGQLEKSTALFGKLADPEGANNPLSQVLYGLALRHGWGCATDPERALTYLSHAASNSADIESLALSAGMKKGGTAKGELVLAIFELGNCFRHAWGVKRDPVAARHYYETAANLGDLDGMNEVAWCYLEGFGCKKDKHKAAQYLRRAEEKGGKTVGNSWYVLCVFNYAAIASYV